MRNYSAIYIYYDLRFFLCGREQEVLGRFFLLRNKTVEWKQTRNGNCEAARPLYCNLFLLSLSAGAEVEETCGISWLRCR